jgi:hypothetical protein
MNRAFIKDDPLDALRQLTAEYEAATNQQRNHGSCRFAHLFYSYVSDLLPVMERRRDDRAAELEEILRRASLPPEVAAAEHKAQRRATLKAVK